MNIEIIKAKEHHIETIAIFQQKMAKETESLSLDKATVLKGVARVFTDPSLGQYYIALDGSKIVGSLLITYEWSDWRNKMVYWIQSVYVLSAYRRKGVFRKMYTHIRDIVISDPHLAGIRLYVDYSNTNAIKVYQQLGMIGSHYQTFEWMKS